MADTLSEEAVALIRLHFDGQTLRMGRGDADSLPGCTVEATRMAYQELVRAGLMSPVSGFVGGPGSHYRITEEAWNRREELQRPDRRPSASAMVRRMRRA